jgi:cholesterol transport system auxiliary component
MSRCILVLSLFLTGCVSLLPDPGPPPHQVFLSLSTTPVKTKTIKPHTLGVERPQAMGDLASKKLRIIHTKNDCPVSDIIEGYEWQEKLPDLLQGVLVADIDSRKIFKGVSRAGEGVKEDWMLLSDIRYFEVGCICQPYVKIEVAFKVVTSPDHALLAHRVFRTQSTLECLTMPDIMDAYSEGMEKILCQLALWLSNLKD